MLIGLLLALPEALGLIWIGKKIIQSKKSQNVRSARQGQAKSLRSILLRNKTIKTHEIVLQNPQIMVLMANHLHILGKPNEYRRLKKWGAKTLRGLATIIEWATRR